MYEDDESPAEMSPVYPFVRVLNPISKPAPKARGAQGFQLKELLTADGIHFTGEEGVIKFSPAARKICPHHGDKELRRLYGRKYDFVAAGD